MSANDVLISPKGISVSGTLEKFYYNIPRVPQDLLDLDPGFETALIAWIRTRGLSISGMTEVRVFLTSQTSTTA